jgi:aspartyl-tRNA(Asn)/glutamyl-tRNA(Gln) amidotransferase subunit A
MHAFPTLAAAAHMLATSATTAESLTRACLERIDDAAGEGARTFIAVRHREALAAAIESDRRRAEGRALGPLDGVPISVKDLFDLEGEVTRAGSKILADAPAAAHDAPSIARLKSAGAVIVGRTNMTEFAYGAHGTNVHYGTPANLWDRPAKRIPGGSTSGGAVSVTDGMALATIGSDTGGSVRIPAALCGLAGFKPTQARVPLAGAFPLSHTRDSIGPLGKSAACCILLDHVMAGRSGDVPRPANLSGITLAVPTSIVLDALEPAVEAAFSRALSQLSRAGARIREIAFSELVDERDSAKQVNFSGYEAYQLHRERLDTRYADFDPCVGKRLMLGAAMRESDYRALVSTRAKLIASADRTTAPFAALVLPTVPIIAPRQEALFASEAAFFGINGLLLRNCAPFNVFDRPAWSLPCHQNGEAPVGLMVVGAREGDDALQALGLAVEAALAVPLR